jgi:hypothetical protein
MPIQTYRDSTGRIFTADGQHIASLPDYQKRVVAGEISGKPIAIASVADIPKTSPTIPVPTSSDKNTYRMDDGSIAYKTAVDLSGLDKFKNQTQFIDAVKDIIGRRQKIQQPLSEAKDYWRSLQGATGTSAFGSIAERGGDPATSDILSSAGFKDKDFRLLDPSDQASIRAARFGAAQAHLQGIAEEEAYRGTRVEDMIKAITDQFAEKDKMSEEENDKTEELLNILKKKKDLGLPISDSDYEGMGYSAIDSRIGGSLSWRHNNPGNIKYGKFAEQYGAIQGQAATDGGYFAIFPDLETGKKAMRDLLKGNGYKDLTVDAAMKRWSNSGYGAEVWTNPDFDYMRGWRISSFSDAQIDSLIESMIKREGWKEGVTTGETGNTDIEYISQLTDIPVSDLNTYSADELALLKETYEEITKAGTKTLTADEERKALYQEMSSLIKDEISKGQGYDKIYPMIVRLYGNKFNNTEIEQALTEAGL